MPIWLWVTLTLPGTISQLIPTNGENCRVQFGPDFFLCKTVSTCLLSCNACVGFQTPNSVTNECDATPCDHTGTTPFHCVPLTACLGGCSTCTGFPSNNFADFQCHSCRDGGQILCPADNSCLPSGQCAASCLGHPLQSLGGECFAELTAQEQQGQICNVQGGVANTGEYCPQDASCKPNDDCSGCWGYPVVSSDTHVCGECGDYNNEWCPRDNTCVPAGACITGCLAFPVTDSTLRACRASVSSAACQAQDREYCPMDTQCYTPNQCSACSAYPRNNVVTRECLGCNSGSESLCPSTNNCIPHGTCNVNCPAEPTLAAATGDCIQTPKTAAECRADNNKFLCTLDNTCQTSCSSCVGFPFNDAKPTGNQCNTCGSTGLFDYCSNGNHCVPTGLCSNNCPEYPISDAVAKICKGSALLDGATCHLSGEREYCPSDNSCKPGGDCITCKDKPLVLQQAHTCIERGAVSGGATSGTDCQALGSFVWCPSDQHCHPVVPTGCSFYCTGFPQLNSLIHECQGCSSHDGFVWCPSLNSCVTDCTTCTDYIELDSVNSQCTGVTPDPSAEGCHAESNKEYCATDNTCKPDTDCSSCIGLPIVNLLTHSCAACSTSGDRRLCTTTNTCVNNCATCINFPDFNPTTNTCTSLIATGDACFLANGGEYCRASGTCIAAGQCAALCNGLPINSASHDCAGCSTVSSVLCAATNACIAPNACLASCIGFQLLDEVAGTCIACTPNCIGRTCGDDGCGASCGTCPVGETCDQSAALPTCSVDYCVTLDVQCNGRGTCVNVDPADAICICDDVTQYTGKYCETPVCTTPCGIHGTCTLPNTCSCHLGYAGSLCDQLQPHLVLTRPGQGVVVEVPPNNFLIYTLLFNQEIQLRGSFNIALSIENDDPSSSGGTNIPTISSSLLSVSDDEKQISFGLPIQTKQKINIIIPKGGICSKSDITACWTPKEDPHLQHVFGLMTVLGHDTIQPVSDLTMTMAVSKLDSQMDPCVQHTTDYWKSTFQSSLQDLFAVTLTVVCTSCESNCNLALVSMKKKTHTLSADFTLFAVYVVHQIFVDTIPVLASMMSTTLQSGQMDTPLTIGGLGPVLPGTVHVANGVVEVAQFDVRNTPDANKAPTEVEVSVVLNAELTARGLVRDGKIQVLFPFDWKLDTDADNWKAIVQAPFFGSKMYNSGEFTIEGQVVTIDLSINNFINSVDASIVGTTASALTVIITFTQGAIMPDLCRGLNGWLWAVLFVDSADHLTQFKLANVLGDSCNEKSVFVFGDPHFVSFSGGSYDVIGRAGFTYNIISHPNLQWNAEFVSLNPRSTMFTYIGRTGFWFNGSKVVCEATTKKVIINNKEVEQKDYDTRLHLPTTTRASPYYVKVTKELIFLRVPGFRIVLKYVNKDHGKYLPHFDHFVEMADDLEGRDHVHGLLGQTAAFTNAVQPKGKNGQGVIEGLVRDYEVPSLFSTEFKFNRYRG